MSYSIGFQGANTWVIWLPFEVFTTGKPLLPQQFVKGNLSLLKNDPTVGGTFNRALGLTIAEILETFDVSSVYVTRKQISVAFPPGKSQAEAVARLIESKGDELKSVRA